MKPCLEVSKEGLKKQAIGIVAMYDSDEVVEHQERKVAEYARSHDMELSWVYLQLEEREDFVENIPQFLESKAPDAVIVSDLSTFGFHSWNWNEVPKLVEVFNKAGVSLVGADIPIPGPDGTYMEGEYIYYIGWDGCYPVKVGSQEHARIEAERDRTK